MPEVPGTIRCNGRGVIAVVLVHPPGVLQEVLLETLGAESDLLVTRAFSRIADVPCSMPLEAGSYVVLCEAGLFEPDHVQSWATEGAGVVLVADPADEHVLVPAVLAGVRGWVSKEDPYTVLPQTLRCVAAGGTQMPSRLLTLLLSALAAAARQGGGTGPPAHVLTDRERQVLELLADGRTRPEIATALHVSTNTVRTHVRRILAKLEVHSSLTAVAVGRRLGLVGPPYGLRQ